MRAKKNIIVKLFDTYRKLMGSAENLKIISVAVKKGRGPRGRGLYKGGPAYFKRLLGVQRKPSRQA